MLSGGSAIAISAVFDYTGIGRLNTTTSLYDPAAQPIRGAYVVVFGSGSPALASAYTNDSGAISLSVTPPADNTGFYFVIETASNPQTATGIYRVVMPDRTSMPYSFTTQTFSYDYTAPPQALNAGTVAIPDTLANLTVDSAFAAFDGLTVGRKKGTFYFSGLRGRPRGRIVACKPSCLTAIFVQLSDPNGVPRAMLRRRDSSSDSL
jgi:hypothetical protein